MGVIGRLFKRSLENPRVPLSAFASEFERHAKSGANVTRESSISVPAAWQAVNLVSRGIAKVPLQVFKRDGQNKEVDREHPAYKLLRYRPNEETSSFIFIQTIQAQAILLGNGYAVIERDQFGSPLSLIQVDPSHVTPVRIRDRETNKSQVFYIISVEGTSEKIRLESSDVIHIKGLGWDGLSGLSLVQFAKETFGLSMASRDFGSTYFRNAGTPKIVLETPSVLNEEAATRLRNDWERMHTALNAHRTAVLESGMKAHVLQYNHKDTQLVELRQFQVREIASLFNVPPHKLGDATKASFSSLEQENQSYLDESLDPWMVNWELECREKVLTEREKEADSHIIEFNRRALARVDAAGRSALYSSGIQTGWLSRDEVRAAENLPPIPDGEGEVFLVPVNLMPAGAFPDSESESEPDTTREQARECARVLVEETLGKVSSRLCRSAERASSKPDKFLEWIDSLEEKHGKVIHEMLENSLRIYSLLHGEEISPSELVGRIIGRMKREMLDLSSRTTGASLPGAVKEWGEKIDLLESVI